MSTWLRDVGEHTKAYRRERARKLVARRVEVSVAMRRQGRSEVAIETAAKWYDDRARGHRERIERVEVRIPDALEQLFRNDLNAHSNRAKRALAALTDSMAFSLPELRTLRRTLVYWRKEILAYFYCRLTNARTEGFNGKAKLVIRRAYGYKSFRNYRLRLLNSA